MKFILGKKIEMSQLFDEVGRVIPVTWIKVDPCFVTQVKNEKNDGYAAVQVGFDKKKKTKKSEKGKEYKFLREFRVQNEKDAEFKKGDKIDISVFKEGDKVKISGVSKAKGFQGVVKRWNFKGAPKSHGTKHTLRKGGSIGSTGPAKVFKGKKMAGRMGGEKKTISGLKIVKIDKDKNLMAIKGAIPGKRNGLLEIKPV